MMFWKYIDAIDHPESVPFPDCEGDIVWEDDSQSNKSVEWYEREERRKTDSYRALMELIATRKGAACG